MYACTHVHAHVCVGSGSAVRRTSWKRWEGEMADNQERGQEQEGGFQEITAREAQKKWG